jgi:hypothetical protein
VGRRNSESARRERACTETGAGSLQRGLFFEGSGVKSSKQSGDRFVGTFDSCSGLANACSNNGLGPGNPEFDTVRVVVFKSLVCGEEEDVAVRCKHERARIVQGLYCGLETIPPDGLTLKRSMAVSVKVACVPEGPVKSPKEVDELANPEVPGKVSSIDHESHKESLLKVSPFAGETSSKELTPAKHSLFLTEAGNICVIVMIGETCRSTEDFVVECRIESVLQGWSGVFRFVEGSEIVEQLANKGKATGALV